MTNNHANICANNCIYAKKVMWLSRAGTSEATSETWLYRCTKLEDRIITTDSVIHDVGCATYTTGKPVDSKDDMIKRAQEMLDEINQKIKEDKKKEVPAVSPVQEQVKPGESPKEPVVVHAQTTTTTNEQLVHFTPTPQITTTEEPVKKKRGRKPKQATVEPAPVESAPAAVDVAPEIPKELIKDEMIKDGGSTDGTKT